MRIISKNWDVTRQDGGEIADGRIDCLVALSLIFAKRVNLQRGIIAYERGWHPETEPIVLEHRLWERDGTYRYILVRTGTDKWPNNPLQKPIENVALSAKWNVHIWNRLTGRDCYSRLYTGTLKTPVFSVPTSEDLKSMKLETHVAAISTPFAIGTILKTSQSNCEMRAALPRAPGACAG